MNHFLIFYLGQNSDTFLKYTFSRVGYHYYGESELLSIRMMPDNVNGWISGLESVTKQPCLCALLAHAEDQAGWEIALWRAHPPFLSIYRPFVWRQLCSHYRSTGFTQNLLDSISSDAQRNIEGYFTLANP